MKRIKIKAVSKTAVAIGICLVMFAAPVFAQGGNKPIRTDSRILYHNGPVMQGSSNVYTIFYGNWGYGPGNDIPTADLVREVIIGLGTSQYFQINVGYKDALGNGPNGGLVYSGTADDAYSQGAELSVANIQEIVRDKIVRGVLPLDGAGIYIVFGTADVSANAAGFCVQNAPPHHGYINYFGAQVKYAFIGNPLRCPTLAAPQLSVPSPNDNFAADGIANNLAAVLSAAVSNPADFGWFDRYGLENSAKCKGTFGETYTTANGARANMQLGTRHWLIQQNWVNSTRKGYCALAPPQP